MTQYPSFTEEGILGRGCGCFFETLKIELPSEKVVLQFLHSTKFHIIWAGKNVIKKSLQLQIYLKKSTHALLHNGKQIIQSCCTLNQFSKNKLQIQYFTVESCTVCMFFINRSCWLYGHVLHSIDNLCKVFFMRYTQYVYLQKILNSVKDAFWNF